MPKICVLHGCYLALRSRSKVGVKVKGRGHGQRSGSRSNFWRAAVDIRSSALLSAAKSKEQVINPRSLSVCRIIARMQ